MAGVDPRVKAAVPIYGNGWESYSSYPPAPEPQVTEDNRLWRLLIAPRDARPAHPMPCAVHERPPTIFHGKMDLGYRSLDLLASPVRRLVFTPNYDHHIEPAEARSLPLWMDAQLRGQPAEWPATPTIKFAATAEGGVPQLRVTTPDYATVDRVDIYYSLSNDWPMSRFWRTVAPPRREGNAFLGAAPLVDSDDVI